MAIPKINVSVDVYQLIGVALANASVRLTLTRPDIVKDTGEIVALGSGTIVCDGSGHGVGPFFPNAMGTQGTQYLVEVFDADGMQRFPAPGRQVPATLPNMDVALHACLFLVPPLTLSDAQYWSGESRNWATYIGGDVPSTPGSRSARSWAQDNLIGVTYGGSARDWSMGAGVIDGIYYSSRKYSIDSKASADASEVSRQAADADKAGTAADRIATGNDRTQTGIDKAGADASSLIASGAALTAVAQAGAALLYSLAAASAVTQDISGVTAAALHRSPNAVTAFAIYDTSKDSNPGWPAQVDASYLYETLNGAWIDPTAYGSAGITSELMARCYKATLGAEQTVNGGFSADTNWGHVNSGGGVWSIANGVATCNPVFGQFPTITQNYAYTAGTVYAVTVVITRYSVLAGTVGGIGFISKAGRAQGANFRGVGTHTIYFVAAADDAIFGIQDQQGGTSCDVDSISVRPVTAITTASGIYYPNATDGKFYRLWKNLVANSGLTGGTAGTIGAGAVAPTGWSLIGTGQASFPASTKYTGANAIRFVTAAQSAFIQTAATINAYAGVPMIFSFYVEALASASTALANFAVNQSVAGTMAYRKNGVAALSTDTFAAGDFIEYIFTPTASGVMAFRVGPGANAGGPTMDVTLSPMQFEYALGLTAASAYEAKPATIDGTQTETFRGNTARFPRVAGIVVELQRVIIYDLLSPGRPMWMVFYGVNASNVNMLPQSQFTLGNGNTSVAALNARMYVGSDRSALQIVDFAQDAGFVYGAAWRRYPDPIAGRNSGKIGNTIPGGSYNQVYAVGVTVLPDAPVDPVTGLQAATIALGTSTGVCVIKHDSSVVNSASGTQYNSVSIDPYNLWAGSGNPSPATAWAMSPGKLGAGFVMTNLSGAAPDWAGATASTGQTRAITGRRGRLLRNLQSAAGTPFVGGIVLNEANPTASLSYKIGDTYSTGFMLDPRRCLLADVDAGVSDGTTTKIVNGTFNADLSGWTPTVGGANSIAWNAGSARFTFVDGGALQLIQTVPVVTGKAYRLRFTATRISGTGVLRVQQGGLAGAVVMIDGQNDITFTASSTGALNFTSHILGTGAVIDIDNVILTDGILDRSVKGKELLNVVGSPTVNGTGLVKTAVGAASQLVAWSGFSATSFIREAWNADLDFGTGSWYMAAWVNFTTVGSASIIMTRESGAGAAGFSLFVDATNKLNALATDGATVRTATSVQAYNGNGWVFVEGMYSTSGTVTVKANGELVGQVTGAPLLTLNNAAATLTIGNNSGGSQPMASGSIALARIGGTVPTDDQSRLMYQQEKAMFRDGAQVTLPDSGQLLDLDYDPPLDRAHVTTAANEASFVGFVRAFTAAATAGANSRITARSGLKLVARTASNPGVDITTPSLNLKEELAKAGAEQAALRARGEEMFDYAGGFTATTATGFATLASVANLNLPLGVNLQGASVSGVGIPANTTIAYHSGTTIHLSAPVTSGAAGTQINLLDFPLPAGMEARSVFAGVPGSATLKQEGSTKDYSRLFDGTRERPRFGTAPGNTAHVRVNARRIA